MIFNLSPQIRGYLTPADLLTSEGTFHFTTEKSQLINGGYIFQIQGEGFIFNLSVQNLSIVVQRNETISVLTLDKIPDKTKLIFFIMWSYSELSLICRYGIKEEDQLKAVVPNSPISPPNNLLKWTRLNNLIPTIEYESAEIFRTKIHSCLVTINEKIEETGGFYPFWNISYEKGKIVDRKPKNEIEVQPIIQCLLSDQMLASSIDVIPEFKGGVGNLDFLFIAQVKGRGSVYFCAEFKNAHSDKVFDGLTKQLPAYIKNKKADYGAYCMLNYFGEWLEPSEKFKNIEFDIRKTELGMGVPFVDKIRVFNFNLAKPISASRL
jgi:hypothetical protein